VSFIGSSSVAVALSSKKVNGTPIFSEMSALPERREPYGNVSAAMMRTARKMYPKISPILFVGIN